jgi:hypothetical protein
MNAAFRQVDVNLLFPDGLCVLEVERCKLHQIIPRAGAVQRSYRKDAKKVQQAILVVNLPFWNRISGKP